ncbi:MAG TPA: RNA methyltransferase [Acidimicrobiales bacterium]|nr:RNA methyltransferase [Acidimicrobiales bacterium]
MAEALAAGVDVVEVYAEPGAPGDVLDAARTAGVPVRDVAAGALAKATSPVTPQPVAALAALPGPVGDDVLRGLVLVLVGVADPGNAGTLLRVAEASGASAVVSCADAVDLWNPKCVRASAGSIFRVPVVLAGPADDALARLRAAGMTVVATALGAAVDLDDADLRGDVAVLLGNEAHGLPADLVAAADLAVRIPMAGHVESLNVAMTGTVIAFEAARQRRGAAQ